MASPEFSTIASSLEDGVLVVRLSKSQMQDEKTAEALLLELDQALSYYKVSQVVVDMQSLRYLSSVAFRPLLHLRRRIHQLHGKLLLCGLSHAVGDIFRTTRLVSSDGSSSAPFEISTDVASALAQINSDKKPE